MYFIGREMNNKMYVIDCGHRFTGTTSKFIYMKWKYSKIPNMEYGDGDSEKVTQILRSYKEEYPDVTFHLLAVSAKTNKFTILETF